ncbi:MAG: DUF255 domain-containing protein [Bacteroidetes bacterium]|nr:DUF255 domain-containing protein [Bacteroidota bacterium]
MIKLIKLVPVLLLLLTVSFTESRQTAEVNWVHWNDGFARASKEGKIALIDTYTAWCGWCKKMDATTYMSAGIQERIEKYFVPIKFNPELSDTYNVGDTTISGRALLGALSQGRSSGYPTTFFYVPAKNVMYQYPGYMDSVQFAQVLDQMIALQNETASPKSSNP